VIDYRAALKERSGVGEYTHELVRALGAGGRGDLSLTLFSSSWRDRVNASGLDARTLAVVDRRIPVRALNFAWHRLEWPPVEALTRAGVDVAHSMHPLLIPSRTAARVVTIHDLNFLSHPERTRAEIRRDYPALARDHAHRANHIVVPSHFTAREVEHRLDVAPEQISVCSPGAPAWPPRRDNRARGYVLFFGTLEPRKNVGALLDAYERLAAKRADGNATRGSTLPELVLAGKATDQSGPWLSRLARPPLAGLVRHIGYVDPANRRELYDGARLLVQPSFEEGFGMPVLEAMTVGLPVVAADRGALPEVLGDAGALVDPDNPEQIAIAIERMLDDEGYAGACASKGVLKARDFTWAAMADKVVAAYRLAIRHRDAAGSTRRRRSA
jgi:glycosyltransferase involved in cell wall biosynthesis